MTAAERKVVERRNVSVLDNDSSVRSTVWKDTDGVWRGQADKDGTNVAVWLDYKGNVGTN